MRLVASAQAFGFGPVAKLVAMLGHLGRHDVTFIGQGIALRYAELNHQTFSDVRGMDLGDKDQERELVRTFDAGVSVMEPDLVYACVRERVPVHFFDSLTGFWMTSKPIDNLLEAAETIIGGTDRAAAEVMGSLSVHESMVVSHMLATRSYAQSFPGVAERIAAMKRAGVSSITMTSSMVDRRELNELRLTARPQPRLLVVNLGGFTNAFLNGINSSYVRLILRWLVRVAETTRRFDEIIVCSGAFHTPRYERRRRAGLRAALLPHRELMELLAGHPVYLTAPGLTSLHEAFALGMLPMLLPDQHYGHAYNRRSLHGTDAATYGATFADLGLGTEIPEDDRAGTLALADVSTKIDGDRELFEQFASYMDERLESFAAADANGAGAAMSQFEQLVQGVPIAEVMNSLDGGVGCGAGRHAN